MPPPSACTGQPSPWATAVAPAPAGGERAVDALTNAINVVGVAAANSTHQSPLFLHFALEATTPGTMEPCLRVHPLYSNWVPTPTPCRGRRALASPILIGIMRKPSNPPLPAPGPSRPGHPWPHLCPQATWPSPSPCSSATRALQMPWWHGSAQTPPREGHPAATSARTRCAAATAPLAPGT